MAQAVLFFTGFETGDTGPLASLGAGASIQGTTVRTGAYALKNAATGSSASTGGGTTSVQFVVRFYLQVPALPGADTAVFVDRITGAASRLTLSLTSAGSLKVSDAGATLGLSTTTGTATLSTGTWYRIEVIFDGAASGVVKVLVNGTTDINVTHTSDVSASPTSSYRLQGAANPNEYFFDDLRIDGGGTTAIGAGQTVARQGKAGTPTYDSWTKTGLTTAADCWSETPFSATNNCNSSTISAAQTMLVAAFSATQSGHGSQTVGASDTVNACTSAVVAKRATSGQPKIRRRVNSVDTDTNAPATSASDKYLDDGVWTTTVANLDLLEVGMVKAADANLTTVEDAWIMVDYTPAVVVAKLFLPTSLNGLGSGGAFFHDRLA